MKALASCNWIIYEVCTALFSPMYCCYDTRNQSDLGMKKRPRETCWGIGNHFLATSLCNASTCILHGKHTKGGRGILNSSQNSSELRHVHHFWFPHANFSHQSHTLVYFFPFSFANFLHNDHFSGIFENCVAWVIYHACCHKTQKVQSHVIQLPTSSASKT